MRLAICGMGRSGKDSAAEYLATCTPLRYKAGTSLWAAPLVFERLRDRGYKDTMECWHDRHNHRQLWADTISLINREDPVRLYRDCLKDQDLLTGVRWLKEMQACKAANLVDLWLWIERPGIEPDPTCQIKAEDCDVSILNSGTLEEYHAKLRRFANFLNKSRSLLTQCQ